MNELTSCPPPKGKACVAGSIRFGAIFCVDDGNCVTLKLRPREVLAADCSVTSTTYEILDTASLVIGLHTGGLVRVPCEALRVKLVDACATAGGPAPVASLNIEFSETLLYSAATEQALMRLRRYNEITGVWALSYENLDGTPFTGALPTDLVAQTAQVNVTRTTTPGCAANVAYTQRETARFDAETGVLESELVDWTDSTGAVLVVAPAGFSLGACVDPAIAQIAANTAQTGAAINATSAAEILAANAASATEVAAITALIDSEHVKTDGCVEGVYVPRLDTFAYNQTTGLRIPVDIQYLVGGVWGQTTPTNWIAGPCPTAAEPLVSKVLCTFGSQHASGALFPAYVPSPAFGSSWSPPIGRRVQSFTVTPLKAAGTPNGSNYVQVTLDGSNLLRLTEEYPSYTWSVAQDNGRTAEELSPTINVTAVGDAAFAVVWVADCPPVSVGD